MDASTGGESTEPIRSAKRTWLLVVLVIATVALSVVGGLLGGWSLAFAIPAVMFTLAMAGNVVLRLVKQGRQEQK